MHNLKKNIFVDITWFFVYINQTLALRCNLRYYDSMWSFFLSSSAQFLITYSLNSEGKIYDFKTLRHCICVHIFL